MDSILSTALEEICVRGAAGIPVAELWPSLKGALSAAGLPLSTAVCRAIWDRLLVQPALRFAAHGSMTLQAGEPSLQSLEDAEVTGVRIVAEEKLRDNFLGIYDLHAANSELSETQKKTLELLAASRSKGITQNELGKEFEKKGNYFFYVVRNLECQKLVVRQPTIIWEKDSEAEFDNARRSNLIHLYRYAKNLNLNSQQRFEIKKADALEDPDNADGSILRDDMSVKDFLPAIKNVCGLLEKASEKTLPVKEIKSELGFTSRRGQREWKNIFNRLKAAHLVEQVQVAENKECVRLLKKFDLKDIHARKSLKRPEDSENEYSINDGKRGHITDQLVELPLDNCIYDLVDAAGPKGITRLEVCKRLGFKSKKLDRRLKGICKTFGIINHFENCEKNLVQRMWTHGNYLRYSTGKLCGNSEPLPVESNNLVQPEHSTSAHFLESAQPKEGLLSSGRMGSGLNELQPYNVGSESLGDLKLNEYNTKQTHNAGELGIISIDKEMLSELDAFNSRQWLSTSSNPSKKIAIKTIDGMRREGKILKILEKEKFILQVELHKDLENSENKGSKMDRKTVIRILNKLQQEGACKIYKIRIPVTTNFRSTRLTDVVLLPSVDLSQELLEEIYKRQRTFDALVRSKGSVGARKSVDRNATVKAMRLNGYVPAIMVRARLFHMFLWGHVSSLPEWQNALNSEKRSHDQKNPQSTCQLFALDKVAKEMPLQLFLQVVGSRQEIKNMIEHCRLGSRLSDIPLSDYKNLMNISAAVRLSRLVNILIRLKLIQLVRKLSEDNESIQKAVLVHSLELYPYIEEPLSLMRRSSHLNADRCLRIRHDFELLKQEAVDAYWQTFEYCYAAADVASAADAFPGSSVKEVFHVRSWSSIRVMTAEQRTELLKRVASVSSGKKISFQDCVRIAMELNLTVEQVLRVSYDKRQSRLHIGGSKPKSQENSKDEQNSEPATRKRKRRSKDGFVQHAFDQNEHVDFSRRKFSATFASKSHANASKKCRGNESDSKGSHSTNSAGELWRKSKRSQRFIWTESSDRELIKQYARYRVTLGAKFFRVDWNSLSGRPAEPAACCKRMTELKKNQSFWTALMRLCNRLRERYDSFVEKTKARVENEPLFQDFGPTTNAISESNSLAHSWDDFGHPDLKTALDEVFRYKRPERVDRTKRLRTMPGAKLQDIQRSDDLSLDLQDSIGHEKQNEGSLGAGNSHHLECQSVSNHATNRENLDNSKGKYVEPLNRRYLIARRRVCESLTVANAVELLKLVLLSSSSASQAHTSLAAMLQLYSEKDVFAAYSYLKEKSFMVAGHGSRPFVLSKNFWHHASSSPFPVDSGKRASDFSKWLMDQDNDQIANGIDLSPDLQCGEVFHLFAHVWAGEISIHACLPKDGIGEADEMNNSETMPQIDSENCDWSNIRKRKSDVHRMDVDKLKKYRTEIKIDNDCSFRREKGFPGIKIVLRRESNSTADAAQCPLREEKSDVVFSNCEIMDQSEFSNFEHQNLGTNIMSSPVLNELPWDDIASYAQHLCSTVSSRDSMLQPSPKLIKAVHSAVCQAGELGLCLKQISQIMDVQGEQLAEVLVDTLEVFQLAFKVNSYDDLRVLSSLYKSKYLISIDKEHIQDPKELSNQKTQDTEYGESCNVLKEDSTYDAQMISTNLHDGHRVTVIGLTSQHVSPNAEGHDNNASEVISGEKLLVASCLDDGERSQLSNLLKAGTHMSFPILPWINADGSMNTTVYKALTRRIIGIVMQNPGMLEEGIIRRMDVLNPQSCRKLLELMILDNHLIVRMLQQSTSTGPPSILQNLFSSSLSKQDFVFRKHFFANPMRTSLL